MTVYSQNDFSGIKFWRKLQKQESFVCSTLVQVSHGLEKSNDFSGKKTMERIAELESKNLSKKLNFFLQNLFKTHFSLDNKEVQEKFYCEKDFSAEEIYLLEKTYVF